MNRLKAIKKCFSKLLCNIKCLLLKFCGIFNGLLLKLIFSKDCITWALLPPATEAMRKQAKLAKGRFLGDPSYEYEHTEIKKIYGEGDEVTEQEETVS